MELLTELEVIDIKKTRSITMSRFAPTGEVVCVKKQTFASLDDANSAVKEVLHQTSIQHSSVCKVYKFFIVECPNKQWQTVIVMESMPSDLESEVKKRKREGRPWSDSELLEMLKSLVGALALAQEKEISHRNLSLANLFVNNDGRVKIADFGSSKWENAQIAAHTFIGTQAYLSPELLLQMAKPKVKHNLYKSDVYALGVCFLFMSLLIDQPAQLSSGEEEIWNVLLSAARGLTTYPTLQPVLVKMLAFEERDRPDFLELSRLLDVPVAPNESQQGPNPFDVLQNAEIQISADGATAVAVDSSLVVQQCEECRQPLRFEDGKCNNAMCASNRLFQVDTTAVISPPPLAHTSMDFAGLKMCIRCGALCSQRAITLPRCAHTYCGLPCFLAYVSSRTCNFQLRNTLYCERCEKPFYYTFVYRCVGGAQAYFNLSLGVTRKCAVCSLFNSQYRMRCGRHYMCFQHFQGLACPAC